MTDQIAKVENTGPENDGPTGRAGKWRTKWQR